MTAMFASIWVKLIGLAAIAAVILGAYLYVHGKTVQIEALRADKAQAEANTAIAETAAKSSASALTAAQKQYAADQAAADRHYKALQALNAATNNLLEAIENAPAADDGPVAPVLMRTLDCLRERATAAPGAGSPDCPADPAGGALGQPSPAGGAASR